MNKFDNYQNEFTYIGFEIALAKSFLDWRANPLASFRSIFRQNFDPYNKYKGANSKEILNITIHSALFNLEKQVFISAYDYLRNNITPSMSNAIKKIKTCASNTNDNLNTAKFLDVIRQSIVHNDIDAPRPNCKLTDSDTVVISYKNFTFTFTLEGFNILTTEFIHLKQQRFSFYLETHAKDLIKHIRKDTLTEDKMASIVFAYDDNKKPLTIDRWQRKALYNMFANAGGGLEGRINRFEDFYEDKFFILNDYFPFPHNAGAISRLDNLSTRIIPQLLDNYIDRDTFMSAVLDFEEEIKLIDDTSAPHLRQHLIQFIMDETLLFESTLLMNCLFGLFSSVPASKLQPYIQDLPISASSLRNSLMHGRYFYNYDLGFELYDGKNNSALTHTGTLELKKILNILVSFLKDTLGQQNTF